MIPLGVLGASHVPAPVSSSPLVQYATGTFADVSTAQVVLPQPAAGRVVVFVQSNAVIATPSGWTLRDSQINFAGSYVWDRAGAGAGSWPVPVNGQGVWCVMEIRGGAYLSDVNNPASGDSGAAFDTFVSFSPITPTAGSRLIIGAGRTLSATGQPVMASYTGWSAEFTEIADLTVMTPNRDAPALGVAVREVVADGSTSYNAASSGTLQAGRSSGGRSSIMLAYAHT